MPIDKPYPRIFIQQVKDNGIEPAEYMDDARYVDDGEATSLIDAARLIIEDYVSLCEYVEPVDANRDTFSHRTYELLLRAATEFEANCKGILTANGYNVNRGANITDYYRLNDVMHLDKFELYTNLWSPERKIRPLAEWANNHVLPWYQAYNRSKHNRFTNFAEATMENVFKGICSLVVLLAAQFPYSLGRLSGRTGLTYRVDEPNSLLITDFTIRFPERTDNEKYNFDWNTLKNTDSPFEFYQF